MRKDNIKMYLKESVGQCELDYSYYEKNIDY